MLIYYVKGSSSGTLLNIDTYEDYDYYLNYLYSGH